MRNQRFPLNANVRQRRVCTLQSILFSPPNYHKTKSARKHDFTCGHLFYAWVFLCGIAGYPTLSQCHGKMLLDGNWPKILVWRQISLSIRGRGSGCHRNPGALGFYCFCIWDNVWTTNLFLRYKFHLLDWVAQFSQVEILADTQTQGLAWQIWMPKECTGGWMGMLFTMTCGLHCNPVAQMTVWTSGMEVLMILAVIRCMTSFAPQQVIVKYAWNSYLIHHFNKSLFDNHLYDFQLQTVQMRRLCVLGHLQVRCCPVTNDLSSILVQILANTQESTFPERRCTSVRSVSCLNNFWINR